MVLVIRLSQAVCVLINSLYTVCVWFIKTGFPCVVLAVLELPL